MACRFLLAATSLYVVMNCLPFIVVESNGGAMRVQDTLTSTVEAKSLFCLISLKWAI